MARFFVFLSVFFLISGSILAAESTSSSSFRDILGACQIEASSQCKDAKSAQGQMSCLTKKSTDPNAKFTSGCKNKIASQKK